MKWSITKRYANLARPEASGRAAPLIGVNLGPHVGRAARGEGLGPASAGYGDWVLQTTSFGPAQPSAAVIKRLRRTNLDLLPVLNELLRTRSVTGCARALGVTQPAVSKALRELRVIFEDDLIVSLGRERRLTDRGAQIVEPLNLILAELGLLLEPVQPFDPTTEPLKVVIRTADYVSVLIAPHLARICTLEAPQVDFQFVDRPIASLDDLDTLDFAIVPRPLRIQFGQTVASQPMWRDEMVCVAARGDDRWGEVISPEEFISARHVAYEATERRSALSAALLQPTAVLEVSPVCEVPNFLVIGAIVEEARCLALVPRRLAQVLNRNGGIRIIPIDFADRRLDIDAFWTMRAGTKRGHAWARGLLSRVSGALGDLDEISPS